MKPPIIELEGFLPYRLSVAADAVSQALATLYQDRHQISNAEWRVIATVRQYPGITAKQIGRHSRMHKVKVSRAITRLEGRRILELVPDPADGRASLVHLSECGTAIYDDLAPRALAFEQQLAEQFSKSELSALDSALTILASHTAT